MSMTSEATIDVTYRGKTFEPDQIAHMEDCNWLLDDAASLREHMREKGYIYLPGHLGRERVERGRGVFIEALQQAGALDPAFDPMEGVLRKPFRAPGFSGGVLQQMFPDSQWRWIHDLLYAGPMMDVARMLCDGEVRAYDFTWTRQVNPGPATQIHSDVVYMGRGTHDLYTAWTPMGDNGFDTGGLLLLEGSNRHEGMKKSYWQSDVDAFCTNKPDATKWGKSWGTGGALGGSAKQLLKSLGCPRWLTADYKMGDVVLFNCYTVHGGTDNRSNKVRLSTDTRYQRADQPIDERWVGEHPVGHGDAGKRGKIC